MPKKEKKYTEKIRVKITPKQKKKVKKVAKKERDESKAVRKMIDDFKPNSKRKGDAE